MSNTSDEGSIIEDMRDVLRAAKQRADRRPSKEDETKGGERRNLAPSPKHSAVDDLRCWDGGNCRAEWRIEDLTEKVQRLRAYIGKHVWLDPMSIAAEERNHLLAETAP